MSLLPSEQSDNRVMRYRVIVEPYEDTGWRRHFRERRWVWTREWLMRSGDAKLERMGYASSVKKARRKALRGIHYEWQPEEVRRAEMVYALEVPDKGFVAAVKPGPLKPRLLAGDDSC